MPAFQPVIITDGTTPKTFNPSNRNNAGTFDYVQANVNSVLEAETIRTIQTQDSRFRKFYMRYAKPQVAIDTDTGVLTTVGTSLYGERSVSIPLNVSLTDRQKYVKYLKDLDTAFYVQLENGELTWS